MTRNLMKRVAAFCDDESGANSVIPFALWTPIFVGILLMSIELGFVTLRHTALERALDETVREVRIGVYTPPQHAELKDTICEKAAMLADCQENLRLEMMVRDLRAWNTIPSKADCVDVSQEVNPVREFTNGNSNQLMILRACYKFTPISPATGFASFLTLDDAGNTALVATSAFVQEPG